MDDLSPPQSIDSVIAILSGLTVENSSRPQSFDELDLFSLGVSFANGMC